MAALPADVSVLLIEHDMDLVFSFARRITVLVNGAVLTEGTPDAIAADPQVRAVYLGDAHAAVSRRMAERLLEVEGLTLRLRRGRGAERRELRARRRPLAGTARAQRHRQDHADRHAGRRDAAPCRPHRARRAARSTRCRRTSAPRAGIGWVPQERNIFKSLTVEENLSAVARPGPWTAQRVFELFPRLAERKRNLGTQLSGGEQQMLAFGRALVLNPKLLLLDEPLEGLAPLIVAELLAAIRRVAREEGLSSIVVEQHPHMVLEVTDEAIVLDRGGIAYRASSAALLADPTPLDAWLGVSSGV